MDNEYYNINHNTKINNQKSEPISRKKMSEFNNIKT